MKKTVKLLVVVFLIVNISSCKVTELQKEIRSLEGLEIFRISDDHTKIILNGVIHSSALKQFKEIINEYPSVKTLHIINCDGSINDRINLKLAQFVYQKGLNTHLEKGGLVASGGTDLFLAGKKRTRGENTRFGVHSWGGENKKDELITAKDFPRDHKYHQPYIKYYVSIGFTQQQAEDFYFFTINAASANNIYWMNDKEIVKYNMITEPVIITK